MISLNFLSEADIDAIHQATLRLLEEVGVELTNPGVRKILLDAGAKVEGDQVKLPSSLVEKVLAGCPEQVQIRARSGEEIMLGDGKARWHNVGGARDLYDPLSGQCRQAKIQDVKDSTRLLDALENVSTISPFFTPQDVPGPLMSLAMYRYSLPYTLKPLQGPGVQTPLEVQFAVQMASVIGPPEDFLTLSVSPVSPLIFPDEVVEAIVEIAKRGIPLAPLPCPTAGVTAPFSLAGSLTQQNAEVLASIVLAQIIRPGLPIVYCGRLAMMEPRTAASVWSGIELALASAATVQLGHYYKLPVNVYGFTTNAHELDIQSGFERGLNAVIPLLAGADELSGVGEMSAGVMGSYAQMVCDNELIASLERIKRGFAVNEDSLGLDMIREVICAEGSFMTSPHTVKYLRSGEIEVTSLAERNSWNSWVQEGRQSMADRAQAEAEKILEEHQVPPLSKEQERTLDDLLSGFEQEVAS